MKKKIRLQLTNVTAVARKFGLHGNAGFQVLGEEIARRLSLPLPKNKNEARAIIRAQPEYGEPTPKNISKRAQRQVVEIQKIAARTVTHRAPDPKSDAFLESYEWRRVRMEVLKRDGARCACCGATPADGVRMHVDHIKPRRHYPSLALDKMNLQVLCEVCNHGKGNWDETDWRFKHEAANDGLGELEKQHIRSISEGEGGR